MEQQIFDQKQRKNKNRTLTMTQLAILTAIMFLFEMTGVGYIPIPPLTIVIMMVPVIIAATNLGIASGTFMGLIFGITAMMQCFGKNALGTFLFQLAPVRTIIVNVGVRIVVGFLTALIFRLIVKFDKKKGWCYAVTGLSGSLLNTLLYITTLVFFFWDIPDVQSAFGAQNASMMSFWLIAMGVVGVNAVIEAIVCTTIGGVVAKVTDKVASRY